MTDTNKENSRETRRQTKFCITSGPSQFMGKEVNNYIKHK